MLSSAVAVQAILSASNFIVGLLLVRRTADVQYGYYVLITTAVLLAITLQNSFIQPPMVIKLTNSDTAERARLIGSLYGDQRRLIPYAALVAVLIGLIAWFRGHLTAQLVMILCSGTVAVISALRREFFRMVLFGFRQTHAVLRSDGLYCVCLVSGAVLATLTPWPATVAALTLGASALIGTISLSRALWEFEPWMRDAPRGALREIASDGGWSAFGGGVHWLFSQGYSYLVAGTISVGAVAELSATKLFVTPVALLSIGVGALMLPTVSKWNQFHSVMTVLKRLALFGFGLNALSLVYFAVMWFARNWIFQHIMKRHFAQADLLLMVWCGNALVTVFRDQLLYLLVARSRFKRTSSLTFACAILSLSSSYILMHRIGVAGAAIGLLLGELCNTVGILVLALIEARNERAVTLATASSA
jgi:O-antigen/teichoic acid export membrane protein